ncbi:hypothetical protein [Tunicatimonas pelagia]|uniref:hypothetical protein n=1 Tax=Tunicatimonas pelagia TaxID=931531 RepID=UPI0026664EA9|nr:hypothetical protein [Tunicatimonas pelagia]WKN42199.1 hypothetical protein P0M28_24485 [Tunicatimonas pelagia]WKN45317.1 hypothetical protein P0M28_10135 [Tunicatimonas pelagia]
MINRKEIKHALPHGKLSEIAKEAGVSKPSVSIWFAGKINSERIEKAAVKIYVQHKKERNKLKKELQSVENL